MAVQLNYYLVAIVDVLGQQAQLADLSELPTTEEKKAEASSVLERTLGRVQGVRAAFESFFAAVQRDHPFLNSLPDDVADQVRDVTRSDVSFQHFSDMTVISVSLASPDGDPCLPASGILDALGAICFAQLATFAAGFAVRGGVEVGLGTRMSEGEIYGPVLSQAHYLESKVAGSPRIVAGPGVPKILQLLENLEPSTSRAEAAIDHARRSSAFLTRDEDGLLMTDFAGPQVHEMFRYSKYPGQQGIGSYFDKAVDFAKSQYEHFLQSGNFKLAARYAWLNRYLGSRKEHWTT